MAQQNVAVAVTTVILNETPNQVAPGVCNWAHHWEDLNSISYVTSGVHTEKSVFTHVVYDSDTERAFADQLEKNTAIKVYAKLPGWFKVPTPLGSYNPDWAVLVATSQGDRLYFVVETKSSLFVSDLRNAESAKIECGRAHFKALAVGEKPVIYDKFKDVAGLLERAQSRP